MVVLISVNEGIMLVPLVLVSPVIPAGALMTFQVIFAFGVVELIVTELETDPEQITWF